MALRMRPMVAYFSAPFRLEAAEGLYPQGEYAVDVHDRRETGSSGSADECMTIFMHLPTIVAGRWSLRSVPVAAREIAKAVLADGRTHQCLSRMWIETEVPTVAPTDGEVANENTIDQAMRVLKKKLQSEGHLRELRERRTDEKPSEKKTRSKAEAVRRQRKLIRKQAQRELLSPIPVKKTPLKGPARPSI